MNIKLLQPPPGWQLDNVGDACDIQNHLRKPISVDERKKMRGEFPYYGPTGVLDYIDHYRAEGKYALIGEDGDHFLKYTTMPMTQLVRGQFNVNNHAHLVRGRDGCTTEWFYHFFRHASIYPFLTRQGAGRYKLNKASLEQLPILLPPLPEQRKIVAILSTWDEAIALTERLIAALQQRKKGLMQRLLTGAVQFPGFEGEAWEEVSLKYILSPRDERAVQSQGLELYSLTIEDGITPKTSRYNREFLVKSKDKKYKKVYPGDIVYNPSNLRWGAIAKSQWGKIVLVSPIYEVLSAKNRDLFDMDFIYHLVSNPDQIQRFSQLGEGTLVERIAVKLNAFLSTKRLIPSNRREQRQIADVLNYCDTHIETLIQSGQRLRRQKVGLMQRLLTGQIRVQVD